MPAICLYFQLHQPYRLRRYSIFDTGSDYFDHATNTDILDGISDRCYGPATDVLLRLVEQHGERFCVTFSLTGCILEQLEQHRPDIIKRFQKLAASGCCEFLSETWHHSLASLYAADEFRAQVDLHDDKIEQLFGQRPRVFRNTELIYSNDQAAEVASWDRYVGMLAEGADHVLEGRSPGEMYRAASAPDLKVMAKNYELSDDIAFRYSNPDWAEYPLTPEKFVHWIGDIRAPLCNLFMDYETFGEHQWQTTGILEFLERFPTLALEKGCTFTTPTRAMESMEAKYVYDSADLVSWADTERDVSAWLGNAMQSNALHVLYELEMLIKTRGDPQLLDDWRKLTTSDHFYYMCTKYFEDGDVHSYFNPYESPYDSYINFMNVVDHLHSRADEPEVG